LRCGHHGKCNWQPIIQPFSHNMGTEGRHILRRRAMLVMKTPRRDPILHSNTRIRNVLESTGITIKAPYETRDLTLFSADLKLCVARSMVSSSQNNSRKQAVRQSSQPNVQHLGPIPWSDPPQLFSRGCYLHSPSGGAMWPLR
jgi:hypothetical protein